LDFIEKRKAIHQESDLLGLSESPVVNNKVEISEAPILESLAKTKQFDSAKDFEELEIIQDFEQSIVINAKDEAEIKEELPELSQI
jgi:hypothetical protein